MKLHPIHRQRAMPDGHDFPRAVGSCRPGIDKKIARQRGGIDHEAVIAGGFDRAGQSGKESFAAMLNRIDLPMHQPAGAHNRAAKHLANRLMPQTDSQNRHPAGKAPHRITRHARLRRRARTGRNHQMRRCQGGDLVAADLIVAAHKNLHAGSDLAQSLHQIPGERIVVVDQQDHDRAPAGGSPSPSRVAGCPSRSISGITNGL